MPQLGRSFRSGSGWGIELPAKLLFPLHLRTIAPERFQTVVTAVFGIKEVNNNIDVIEDDPVALFVTVGAVGGFIDRLAVFLDVVCRGPHLAVRGAGANDKVVANGADPSQVEQLDVFAVIGLHQPGGVAGKFASGILGNAGRAAAGYWTNGLGIFADGQVSGLSGAGSFSGHRRLRLLS